MDGSKRIWATATIMIGTLASVLASSTVNVALADIMNGLQTNVTMIDWVITAYMLANVVAMPCTGWLTLVLGRRNLYALGLLIFMAGSVLAGAAWSIESLIAFRLLQGLGGGLMMPTAQAILFDIFPPHQRGTAMGIYGLGAILGPAFGPTVGGYLIEIFSWRALFYINLPFAALSLFMLLMLMPGDSVQAEHRFDGWGFAWLVLLLSNLQMALGNGAQDGWDNPVIMGQFVLAFLGFVALLWRESTVEAPLIDLSVFRHLGYSIGLVVSSVVGLALFGSTFLLPLYLGTVLGYSALQTGLLMVAGSLVMGVMMLIGGRLSDRIDTRILVGSGLAVLAYALYIQATITLETPDHTFIWALIWRGVGMGLIFSPLSALTLSALPIEQISAGAGLYNLMRQLGGTIGIALLKTLLQTRTVLHAARLGETAGRSWTTAIATLTAALLAHGAGPAQARLEAGVLLAGKLRQEASMLAFRDAFWVSMLVTLLCILPALALRRNQALRPARKPG